MTPATRRTALSPVDRRRGVCDRDSVLRRLDWVLILAVAGLCVIGTLLVWSATRQRLLDAGLDPMSVLQEAHPQHRDRVCLAAFVVAVRLPDAARVRADRLRRVRARACSRCSRRSARTINGSHSWIVLPAGFSIQPSEFAKVALCVGLAMLLSEKRDAEDQPRLGRRRAGAGRRRRADRPDHAAARPRHDDRRAGSSSSASSPCPGRRRPWVLGLVADRHASASAASSQAGVLQALPDRPVRRRSPTPTADPQGTGYNTQAGADRDRLRRLGPARGCSTARRPTGKFVPEQQTDFVFTVAGEELGFVGAGLLILLLGVVLWRGLRIARARRGPVRHAWSRPASSAGSRSRRSRTSG